jgi:hypothetical protein
MLPLATLLVLVAAAPTNLSERSRNPQFLIGRLTELQGR